MVPNITEETGHFLDLLSLGAIAYNANGNLVTCNEMACKLLEGSKEEIDNPSFWSRFVELDKETLYSTRPYEGPFKEFNESHFGGQVFIKSPNGNWISIQKVHASDDKITFTLALANEAIRSLQEVSHQNEIFKLFTAISQEFIGCTIDNFSEKLNTSLANLGKILNADRVYVFDIDFAQSLAHNTFEWCAEGVSAEKENLQNIPMEVYEDFLEKLLKGELVIIEDVDLLPDNTPLKGALSAQHIKSMITAPIFSADKCEGFVGIDKTDRKGVFAPNETLTVKVFANILGSAKTRITQEALLANSKFNLTERLKEQKCIYAISRLRDEKFADVKDYLQEAVNLIPDGFLIPQETYVSIRFGALTAYSQNFQETEKRISRQFHVNRESHGTISIFIPESSYFLPEENDLLEGIARAIEVYINEKTNLQKVIDNEKKLQNLLNSQTNYVLRTDLQGKHTYWNNTFEETFGWIYYEHLGLSGGDSLASICVHHHQRTLETVMACLKEPGKVFKVVLDKPAKSGGIRNTLWEFVALTNEFNEPIEIQCMGQDITDLQNAEKELKKFKTISDQANIGTAITTLEGVITYANHYFEKLHGYEPGELIGKNIADLHTPEQMSIVGTLLEVIKNEGGFESVEVPHARKDGSTVPTLMSARVIRDEAGIPKFMSATAIDITLQKKQEDAIREINLTLENKVRERTQELEESIHEVVSAREEAERANKAKSDFLSRMSHELRTPMNSILGFAQLLEMSVNDEKQQRSIKQILSSGQHLLDLINEVLDIARIESGRITVSMETVNFNNLTNELIETLGPLASSFNVTLNCTCHNGPPVYVKADKQRLKQIMINLVNNAIKYNKENGQVFVRTATDPTSGKVRIIIQDTGRGIAPEHLDLIFNPFERVITDSKNIEGTGLGLSVVKQLAQLMGGTVGVESKLNEGSTFWVELEEGANEQAQLMKELEETKDHQKHNIQGSVLYIEDNQSNIDLMKQVFALKLPKLHLFTAKTANDGLAMVDKIQPNLILLDLHLPDAHGSRILISLKANENTRNTPVIVVSADATPTQIEKLTQLGASGYITKPIDLDLLINKINKYLPQ